MEFGNLKQIVYGIGEVNLYLADSYSSLRYNVGTESRKKGLEPEVSSWWLSILRGS